MSNKYPSKVIELLSFCLLDPSTGCAIWTRGFNRDDTQHCSESDHIEEDMGLGRLIMSSTPHARQEAMEMLSVNRQRK